MRDLSLQVAEGAVLQAEDSAALTQLSADLAKLAGFTWDAGAGHVQQVLSSPRWSSSTGGRGGAVAGPSGDAHPGTETVEVLKPGGSVESLWPAGTMEGLRPAVTVEGLRPAVTVEGLRPAGTVEGLRPAGTMEGLRPAGSMESLMPAESVSASSLRPAESVSVQCLKPGSDSMRKQPTLNVEQRKNLQKLRKAKTMELSGALVPAAGRSNTTQSTLADFTMSGFSAATEEPAPEAQPAPQQRGRPSVVQAFTRQQSQKSSSDQEWLLRLFTELDPDGSGCVSSETLATALVGNPKVPEDKALSMIKSADEAQSGTIERSKWNIAVEQHYDGDFAARIAAMAASRDPRRRSHKLHVSRFMIRQASITRLLWDISLMILLLYVALSVPYQLGFQNGRGRSTSSVQKNLDLFVDVFFLVDIMMNFRTGYFTREGYEVLEWSRVTVNYLRTWFLLDLVSSVPLDWFMTDWFFGDNASFMKVLKAGRVARVFKLLRFSKVLKLLGQSEVVEALEEMVTGTQVHARMSFMGILVMMIILAHWLSCFMAMVSEGVIETYQDVAGSPSREYLAALYWAMTTMSTCGFGDIVPTADWERIYAIVAMTVGCGFWGFVLGNMTSIISSKDLNKRAYYARMDEIQAWLDHHQFPVTLRRRVRRYFARHLTQKPAPDEPAIMNDLSPELRNEISEHLITDDIRCNRVFEAVPQGVLSRLVNILTTVTVDAGDRMVQEGEIGGAMIIIKQGNAKLTKSLGQAHGEEEKTLYPGDSFGEEVVLGFEEVYFYTVTALTNVVAHLIPESDFLNVFWSMPDVLKHMQENWRKISTDDDEDSSANARGRASMVRGTASIPMGFPDAVFDVLEDIQAQLTDFQLQNRRLFQRTMSPPGLSGSASEGSLWLSPTDCLSLGPSMLPSLRPSFRESVRKVTADLQAQVAGAEAPEASAGARAQAAGRAAERLPNRQWL